MPKARLAALALAGCALLPAAAWSQSVGGAVPDYQPPPPAQAPARNSEVMQKAAKAGDAAGAFGTQADVVGRFASAYAANGKPKLALFWNRQLSETLNEWYSDTRIVNRTESNSTMSGEINLDKQGSTQNTTEIQRRVQDRRRGQVSESFEWEFQDGFLAPFLEAGATILDRAAIVRFTGADMQTTNENLVEVRALQGKADFLLEILVAPNWQSSTGYELRTRILEVKTGRIVAMVNSKNLKEWNPEKQVVATDRGFVEPDDDDESFGPQGDDKYRATATGFEKKRKPPKLAKISQNLAYNTMNGLMRQWK
ncbi:conserved exported hypothetical protein [Magnetospirillum sp. LM-5]|uniref:hypothetical protein n=1 Tax=Magnetospirillum sp. LM-5 TaxID=2681466 RepID=UPI001380A13B|nr:hypothetical protein [Magnetospirillum sp. LM-5]CAA7623820.1 conserved exported hypothetical protein [Magnetospirillum sp. LM-5]